MEERSATFDGVGGDPFPASQGSADAVVGNQRPIDASERAVKGSEGPRLPQASKEDDRAPQAPDGTRIPEEVLQRIGEAHLEIPEGFTVHPKLGKQFQARAKMYADGEVDWALAEARRGTNPVAGAPRRQSGR